MIPPLTSPVSGLNQSEISVPAAAIIGLTASVSEIIVRWHFQYRLVYLLHIGLSAESSRRLCPASLSSNPSDNCAMRPLSGCNSVGSAKIPGPRGCLPSCQVDQPPIAQSMIRISANMTEIRKIELRAMQSCSIVDPAVFGHITIYPRIGNETTLFMIFIVRCVFSF